MKASPAHVKIPVGKDWHRRLCVATLRRPLYGRRALRMLVSPSPE